MSYKNVKTLTMGKSGKQYRFDLNETLGKGAFGSVHKGWEVGTKMPVAIKLVDLNHILKMANNDKKIIHALGQEVNLL